MKYLLKLKVLNYRTGSRGLFLEKISSQITFRWLSSYLCNVLEPWRKNLGREKIISSPFPNVEIPKITYPQFVFNQMEKFRNNIFLVNGKTGAKYSYHEALQEVSRVSSALIRLGLKSGDKVAFYSFNSPEYILAWFAVIAVGAVATDANPNFTPDELCFQLKDTNCKFLFVHEINAQKAKKAVETIPGIKKLLVFGEASRLTPYSQLTSDSGDLFQGPGSGDPSDIVHLPYSSGTIGLPKAVMRSHINAISTALVTERLLKIPNEIFSSKIFQAQISSHDEIRVFEEGDSCLLVLPIFHLFGSFMLGCNLMVGSSVVIQETFKPEDTLAIIQKNKVTVFPMVPPLVLFLAQHPAVSKYNLSSLKSILCAAAPVSSELLNTVVQKLSLKHARQGYGCTEMLPISRKTKSVTDYASSGVPVCNTQVKVVSLETGDDLELGKKGEIWARGPQIMSGYVHNKEATESTLINGWFKTGDIGFISSDGELHIVDRLKDFIKVKGHQVAPAELEALLLTHPRVSDAAVVGVPDPRAGEVPRAYLVLKDKKTDTEDIKAYVSERTSPEKYLSGGIHIIDEIPKSASGKILKRELRNMKNF